MTGILLLILFVIFPGTAGAAIAYAVSKGDEPRLKVLAVGAAIGAAVGLTAGLLLFRD
jgi:hypothetical protein